MLQLLLQCRCTALLATVLVLLCCGPMLGGCGVDSHAASAPVTSSRYTLTAGQSVAITPTLTLKLDRINDSRCKQGAVCVWEGFISYTFTLSKKSESSTVVLSEAMPNSAPTAERYGLRLTLAGLEPATPPALDAPVPDYRVTLQVDVTPVPSHRP